MQNFTFQSYLETVKSWVSGLKRCEKCGEWFSQKRLSGGFCQACIRELAEDHVYGEVQEDLLAECKGGRDET